MTRLTRFSDWWTLFANSRAFKKYLISFSTCFLFLPLCLSVRIFHLLSWSVAHNMPFFRILPAHCACTAYLYLSSIHLHCLTCTRSLEQRSQCLSSHVAVNTLHFLPHRAALSTLIFVLPWWMMMMHFKSDLQGLLWIQSNQLTIRFYRTAFHCVISEQSPEMKYAVKWYLKRTDRGELFILILKNSQKIHSFLFRNL